MSKVAALNVMRVNEVIYLTEVLHDFKHECHLVADTVIVFQYIYFHKIN